MHILRKWVAIAALVAAMSGGTTSGQTLKVGSKNLTEQFIVAELYAASLEASGSRSSARSISARPWWRMTP
jgi:osmoprotectant transport system substrate-binding protein